jgi:hypothetical protein
LRSRPARTRDSTLAPPRFRSSARHCPDLKQARQAKLERGTLKLQANIKLVNLEREQRDSENSTVQNHHRAHQRPSNHRGRLGGDRHEAVFSFCRCTCGAGDPLPARCHGCCECARSARVAGLQQWGHHLRAHESTGGITVVAGQPDVCQQGLHAAAHVTVDASLKSPPASDLKTFLTWDAAHSSLNKVRFLVPTSLYRPGSFTPEAPPKHYLKYLQGLTSHGVKLSNVVKLTVDGHPATLMTATSDSAAAPPRGSSTAPSAAPTSAPSQKAATESSQNILRGSP